MGNKYFSCRDKFIEGTSYSKDIGYEMSFCVLVCLIDQDSISGFVENFVL